MIRAMAYTECILENLQDSIKAARAQRIPINRIRVGKNLYALLSMHGRMDVTSGKEGDIRKLFGIPVSIDYGSEMVLEVCYSMPVNVPELEE